MTTQPSSSTASETRYACARVTASIAAIFCATLSVLMLATFLQAQTVAPLDIPELQTLKQQVQQNPGNETFRARIRALDLLARRAHFTTLAALRTGAILLLAGIVVLVTALHIMHTARNQISPPDAAGPPNPLTTLMQSRRALATTATLIIATATLIAIFSPGMPPSSVDPFSQTAPPSTTPNEPKSREPLSPSALATSPNSTPAWPAFRGPTGRGIASNATPPMTWNGNTGENIRWKQPVPRPGYSSPIVWNNRVYLTGGDAEVREVYCFDGNTGALLWRHPTTGIPGAPAEAPEVTEDTGYAAPTMACDGKALYAMFATGNILALSPEGQRIWARNTGVPDNPYGHASSLRVYKNLLLVQLDDNTHGRFLALRTDTGNSAWDISRDVLPCWATPMLVTRNGVDEVILNGNPIVAGYDPATGAERWQLECMQGEVAVSPAWWDETLFVANQYAQLSAIRIDDAPSIIWESYDDLPDVSSPVAWSNRLYMCDSYGVVSCWNVTNGAVVWRHEYEEGFYASPIIANNLLYVTDKKGQTRILKTTDTFTEVATTTLGQPSTITPAFDNTRIYIRGRKHLFCITKEPITNTK